MYSGVLRGVCCEVLRGVLWDMEDFSTEGIIKNNLEAHTVHIMLLLVCNSGAS